jgi:NitT/TauT family transport system permease protein
MKIYIGAGVIAVFFLIWEVSGRFGLIDTQFVPTFSTVIREALSMIKSGNLFIHIFASLLRLFMGIMLAVAVALPLGFLLAGWAPGLSAFLNPLFTNLSMLNPFTLIPVFMLLLGMGEVSKIGLIFWVTLWPALFSAIAGVRGLDPVLLKAARAMGAGGVKIFFSIILPGSVNRIFTGIRSCITLGFTVLVGAEMIGSKTGLGFIVFTSNKNYNIPRMYVGILMIAVTGALVNTAIEKLQKRIVVWEESADQTA